MPAPKRKRKISVFLDSSVFVAAVLSSTGGSFRILKEASDNKIKVLTSLYVQEELNRVLKDKYPQSQDRFSQLIKFAQVSIKPNPQAKQVQKYFDIIHPEDAPILAAAIRDRVDFLITLDKKHFLNIKKSLPISITTPKDFLQNYF